MKISFLFLISCFSSLCFHSCSTTSQRNEIFSFDGTTSSPTRFEPVSIPDSLIIHRGILSNDLRKYYLTVSDRNFSNFNILVSEKEDNHWSQPQKAFFNSNYNDHGMSFSPDGNTLVFSSTRPIPNLDLPNTWHIWICKKVNQKWSEPNYLHIPDLASKLVSHPTLAPDGTIFFTQAI